MQIVSSHSGVKLIPRLFHGAPPDLIKYVFREVLKSDDGVAPIVADLFRNKIRFSCYQCIFQPHDACQQPS